MLSVFFVTNKRPLVSGRCNDAQRRLPSIRRMLGATHHPLLAVLFPGRPDLRSDTSVSSLPEQTATTHSQSKAF